MLSDQELIERPIDAGRPIKVVCIGAGFAGILTAIRFPQRLRNLELVIYDKNSDIGGVWFENRYPGVGCDIPAHAYQFSFANNPNWSRFYAEGGEIHEYLKDVAWKYDVEKYVRFRHRFESAEWNETDHKWIITLKDLETQQVKIDIADVLLKGTGNLNQWDWPEIPGLHDFQGPYMHSAKWDETFDWTDKTVALLGAGSSGIQILPKIQPKAKRVVHFVRNKMWISPVGFSKDEPDNVIHTEEQKNLFAEDPGAYLAYRHKIEAGINQVALVTMRDTEIQKHFWTLCQASMKEKLKKKPWLYEAMCPGSAYPPGCRRLTPGPGYLEALVEDNVEVVNTGVSRVTETGLYDDNGDFHEVDAIIYATGFNYSFNAGSTPIFGRGGTSLQAMWDPTPQAYLSICVSKMPNFFLYLGPNGGPPSGSFIATLEYIAEYMIKCISKMQREHILSMEVRQEALESFSQQVEKYFAKTIFTYKCRSWFKRNQDDGKVVGLWPGSNTHAQQALLNPRYEDFTYVHMEDARDNILSWLGNGLTVAQIENGATTAYLDNVDVPPILNHTKRPKKSPSQNTTPAVALPASAANGIVAREDANGDGDKGSDGFATGF